MSTTTITLNNTPVPLAPLETLSYALLAASDPTEVQRLLSACKSPGFFNLDLSNHPQYQDEIKTLYGLATDYFNQDEEVKQRDFREGIDRGYKSFKVAATYEIARDDLLPTPSVPLPALLTPHTPLLTSVTTTSHTIAVTLLAHLLSSLSLPPVPTDRPSDTALKIATAPLQARAADMPETKHTDGGYLTVQFCGQWGTSLYAEREGEPEWQFVEPRDGIAVVNVGDALSRMSGGVLRSCLHRVGQPVDGAMERIFVNYFLRLANE